MSKVKTAGRPSKGLGPFLSKKAQEWIDQDPRRSPAELGRLLEVSATTVSHLLSKKVGGPKVAQGLADLIYGGNYEALIQEATNWADPPQTSMVRESSDVPEIRELRLQNLAFKNPGRWGAFALEIARRSHIAGEEPSLESWITRLDDLEAGLTGHRPSSPPIGGPPPSSKDSFVRDREAPPSSIKEGPKSKRRK